jgi:hypothetical protein
VTELTYAVKDLLKLFKNRRKIPVIYSVLNVKKSISQSQTISVSYSRLLGTGEYNIWSWILSKENNLPVNLAHMNYEASRA